MSYDSQCYNLAQVFLSDCPAINTEKNRDRLAQAIQTCIEDFINYKVAQQSTFDLNDHGISSQPCPQVKD